jgi:4-hydroxybenzoate polyprenyltransferase
MLIALWVAGSGQPEKSVVAIFIAGAALMRSAGCVINDYADRHLDPWVSRTKDRPLASKQLAPKHALYVFSVLISVAFGLVCQTNGLTVLLALAGLGLTVLYPFMKRVTHLPQFILGATFAWAIPMANAALTQHVPLACIWLYVGTLFWAVAYDTQYAMVDRADDEKIGILSTARLVGRGDKVFIGICQFVMLSCYFCYGQHYQLGLSYQLSLGMGAILCIYQQWLIRHRAPQLCFKAFLNNHWLGAILFLGVWWHYFF